MKFCKHPRCGRLVESGAYCSEHKRIVERRLNSSERGYTWRWHKYTIWFLSRHPLCELCQIEGRVRAATLVDHIKPVSGPKDLNFWIESNHRGLCRPCHHKKTVEDLKGRGGAISLKALSHNQRYGTLASEEKSK